MPTWDLLKTVAAMPSGSIEDLGSCSGTSSETRPKGSHCAWEILDYGQCPRIATLPEASGEGTEDSLPTKDAEMSWP